MKPVGGLSGETLTRAYRRRRIRQVSAMLFVYAIFYICRLAFSASKKDMIEQGLYTTDELGYVGSAMLIAYGIGKCFNGFLADRVGSFLQIELAGHGHHEHVVRAGFPLRYQRFEHRSAREAELFGDLNAAQSVLRLVTERLIFHARRLQQAHCVRAFVMLHRFHRPFCVFFSFCF